MEYTDETIIPIKMEQKEQQQPMSLKEGYYIDGMLETFKQTELYEGKVSICLPESFVDMPQQIKELKYPSAARPQIIKTNLGCDVNFLFNLLDSEGVPGREAANAFRAALEKTNPSMRLSELKTIKTEADLEITRFDYHHFGMDEPIYQAACFAAEAGVLLQFTFSSPERSSGDWEAALNEIIMTIEIRN